MLPVITEKDLAEAKKRAHSKVVMQYDKAMNGGVEETKDLITLVYNGNFNLNGRSHMTRCISLLDLSNYAVPWFRSNVWKGAEYIINASPTHAKLANWLERIDPPQSGCSIVAVIEADKARTNPESTLMLHAMLKNLVCVYDGEESADIEEIPRQTYRDCPVRYTGEFPLDVATPYIREQFMDVINTYAWRNAFISQYSAKIKSVKCANNLANAVLLGFDTITIKTGAKSGGALKGDAKKALEGVQLDFAEDTNIGKQLKQVKRLEGVCKIWNAVSRKYFSQVNINEWDLKDKMPAIEETFKILAKAFDVYPMIDSYYKGRPAEEIIEEIKNS